LDSEDQQGVVTPPERCPLVGRGKQCVDLGAIEEGNQVAIAAFLRDCQDTLDESAMLWLAQGGEAEERADGGEPRIARPCGVAPVVFEVVKEGRDEGCVYVCEEQVARRFAKAFFGEAEEKPEGIAVRGDGLGTRLPLALKAFEEERFEQRRQRGHGCTFQERSS
jgi:hypothetical protein